MASGHDVNKPRTENSEPWQSRRRVGREQFDRSIADVQGVPTRREYVSRYDEGGNFISQGYTHHGAASDNEIRKGTWKH